jgi:hypothetical protein
MKIYRIFVSTVLQALITCRDSYSAYQLKSFTNPLLRRTSYPTLAGFFLPPKYISAIITIIWYISLRRTNIFRFFCHEYVLNLWQINGKFQIILNRFYITPWFCKDYLMLFKSVFKFFIKQSSHFIKYTNSKPSLYFS